MARVSGMRSRMQVPSPACDSTSMVPPIASMLVLTTSMPTPRPETLVTAAAVENPGRKIICSRSCGLIRLSASGGDAAGGVGGDPPAAACRGAGPGRADPGAVGGDLDDDLAALVPRAQGQH